MKLDPSSREELPAVLRVAIEIQTNKQNWPFLSCLEEAREALAAYNESQPDEPSAKPEELELAAGMPEKKPMPEKIADQWRNFRDCPECGAKKGIACRKPSCPQLQPSGQAAKPMPTAIEGRGWYVKDLEDTLATIAKAVGLNGAPDADALIAKVKELAKPMPTREEMADRFTEFQRKAYGQLYKISDMIDYILDGEAK